MASKRLFWISFLVLFVEMASIRWLNASVTILAYFESLLPLGFPLRLLTSALVVGIPVGFASLIFSTSFKEEKNLSNVFGSNLLGIVFGGALEYTSNIWGLNQLYILGLILYVLSLLPKIGAFSAVALGQFSRD